MNKKEKELMNVLRVPSFERANQAANKYLVRIRLLCKGITNASISAKEFNEALIKVNKLMSLNKR